ncbi:hypothetical protein CYMTET_44328 [Cymbomonas tetramitiformis]|uniref:Uncharacterized protein n=1 Tax=Cymbomonas tetramitiformis TaxID=36881 RepID=A0AAE0C0E3_9CHLO|nr:hypothetical protein CYMTET_44328 [Cymbomonas tetramitiformis]
MTVSCGDQYSGALTVARLNMANRYSSGEKHLSDVKNMLTMLGNPDSDTDVQGIATDLIEAHKRIETIKRNLDNTRNDLDSKPSSADVNALRVSVDAAQGRLGLLNTKVARVETDVADNMVINEASADNMNVRIRNFGEELTALQEIVEDDQTHVDTIVETLNRTGELLNTALDNADGLRTDIGALQNEVAEYMGINEDLDHSIGNLRDETRDVNFTILTLRDELAALQERAFALEGTLGERGQEYTAFVVRTEEWLNAVREDTDGLQNAIDGHTRELADLRHGVANNADGLTGQINECRSTSADLRSEAEENMGANERYMGVVEHRILAELRTLRERAIALEGTLGERGPEYTAFVDRTNESLNAVREGTVGLRTDIDAGRRELAALQDEVADNVNGRIRTFRELVALQERANTLERTRDERGQEYTALVNRTDGLQTAIEGHTRELAALQDEVADNVNGRIRTFRELVALQERANTLERTRDERGQEYTALVNRTDGLQTAIEGHTRELAALQDEVADNMAINEASADNMRQDLDHSIDNLRDETRNVKFAILTLREAQTALQEIVENDQTRVDTLERTRDERGREYTALVNRTDGLQTAIEGHTRELAALQDEVADNVNGRIRTFRELVALQERANTLERTRDERGQEYTALVNRTDGLQTAIEGHTRELAALQDEVADNMAINEASADNMRQDLDHSIDNLRDETRNVKFAILTLREALTVLQEIVENDQTRVDTLELTLNERESVLQRQIDECQSTLTDLKSEADGVMSAVSRKIEELNDTGINLSSQSTAFTHLMQHADTRFTTALNAFETNAEAELSVQKERFDTQLQDFKYQMTEALNAAATQLAARKWEEQIQEVKNSVDELKNRPPQPVTEAPVTPGTNLDLEIPKTSVQYNSFFEYIQGLEDRVKRIERMEENASEAREILNSDEESHCANNG